MSNIFVQNFCVAIKSFNQPRFIFIPGLYSKKCHLFPRGSPTRSDGNLHVLVVKHLEKFHPYWILG